MAKQGSTTIEVKWTVARDSRSVEYDEKGDKLPAAIRVMLVAHLLARVPSQSYELDVRAK